MGVRAFLLTLFFILCAAALLRYTRPTSGRTKAPAESCSPDPSFDRTRIFSVSGSVPEPQVSNALPTSEIEALERRRVASSSVRVPGLTVAEYRLKKNLNVSFTQNPGASRVCVWLDSLNLDFSYSKLDVYLAREYPPGTCQYAELMSHESQHVAAYRQLHEEFILRLKEAYQSAAELPTRAGPIWAESQSQGEELIKRTADEVSAPLLIQFGEELERRQAALDTADNYNQLQSRCKDWR